MTRLSIRDRGHLPHWEAEGGTYFITFRLADSLPRSILQAYEYERRKFLRVASVQQRVGTAAERRRAELFSERIEEFLDQGSGACHLADPRIAEIVAEALRHYDSQRYELLAWCVMPNHVHVVMKPAAGETLQRIIHSWKSFSANRANAVLGRRGQLWQREYYDHLIRNEEDLSRVVNYVVRNPERAKLKNWQWVWLRRA